MVIRSTSSGMLIFLSLCPRLSKLEDGEQEEGVKGTGALGWRGWGPGVARVPGFSPVPLHGPALLWGLISMPPKVTAGNLLNATAICLPCSKGTNEKV